MLQNPTGRAVRSDKAGDGEFKSPRGHRYHAGQDYWCLPGQDVVAPEDGILIRKMFVYEDDLQWTGVEIGTGVKGLLIQLLYVDPLEHKIGTRVKKGEVIGTAQDITKRYPGQGMLPHVHMAVILKPDACYERYGKLYVDPDVIGVTDG